MLTLTLTLTLLHCAMSNTRSTLGPLFVRWRLMLTWICKIFFYSKQMQYRIVEYMDIACVWLFSCKIRFNWSLRWMWDDTEENGVILNTKLLEARYLFVEEMSSKVHGYHICHYRNDCLPIAFSISKSKNTQIFLGLALGYTSGKIIDGIVLLCIRFHLYELNFLIESLAVDLNGTNLTICILYIYSTLSVHFVSCNMHHFRSK
jgi:hypothetical protein